jgi:hypothetical protein
MYVLWRAAKYFDELQADQVGLFITFHEDDWQYFREWMTDPTVRQYADKLEVVLNRGRFSGNTRYEVHLSFKPGRSEGILTRILDLDLIQASAPNGQIATRFLQKGKKDRLDLDASGK